MGNSYGLVIPTRERSDKGGGCFSTTVHSREGTIRITARLQALPAASNLPTNLLRLYRLILLVRPLEVRNLMIALEMPYPRRHLIDQIVIMRHQQQCPLVAL
jgi:hypothetical protein